MIVLFNESYSSQIDELAKGSSFGSTLTKLSMSSQD